MTDDSTSRAETVSKRPVVVVHKYQPAPGVPLASGTFALPFAAIRHLQSRTPLLRPYRGEPAVERRD